METLNVHQERVLQALLSRRMFLGAGVAGVAAAAGAKPAFGAQPQAVPVLALSPASRRIRQHVSASGARSMPVCHIDSYLWDWGDGSPQSKGSFSHHVYEAPGNYNVTLTVVENGSSSSAVQGIAVPTPPRVRSTAQLLDNLWNQLGGVPRGARPEMRNLVDMARTQVDRANRQARGGRQAQARAAGRYVAAGEEIAAMNELLMGLRVAGGISRARWQSVSTTGVVPVLASLSGDVNGLNASVLASLAPVAGCGWFWRRGCDLAWLAQLVAIAALALEAIVLCESLAAIPFVGPALAVACAAGVGIATAEAIKAANAWRDGWYLL
jgi:hypothetical protein